MLKVNAGLTSCEDVAMALPVYHGAQAEDSTFIQVFNLPLELLATPTSLEISFMCSVQALVPDGAGLVSGEKSSVSRAEFYKGCVLSIEIGSLMRLS